MPKWVMPSGCKKVPPAAPMRLNAAATPIPLARTSDGNSSLGYTPQRSPEIAWKKEKKAKQPASEVLDDGIDGIRGRVRATPRRALACHRHATALRHDDLPACRHEKAGARSRTAGRRILDHDLQRGRESRA